MPTSEQMRDAVLKYFASFATADVDAIVDLFAEDAVVEDPIGGPRIAGKAAIRNFYASGFAFTNGGYGFEPEGAVRVAGNRAACAAIGVCDKVEQPFRVETIDVMSFDDDGKFTAMQAYWGPLNMKSLSGDPTAGAEAAARSQDFLKSLAK